MVGPAPIWQFVWRECSRNLIPIFEEPVAPENVDEMAKVAAAINIPVAAGERLYTRWSFREMLEKQAVDYIQPDLCHCGGFYEGHKIATLAET